MYARFGRGYSSIDPTEKQVVMCGRKVPDATKHPLIHSPGYGWGSHHAAREWETGVPRWADSGLVAMSGEFGGLGTFGNPLSTAQIDEAVNWLPTQLPCDNDKVLLTGQSMGATDVLNWAVRNQGQVAAIALIAPLVNYQDVYENNRYGLAAAIEAAYEDPIENTYYAFNPMSWADQFADANIPGCIWSSTNDDATLHEFNVQFAEEAGFDLVTTGAYGHSMTGIGPNEVYDFLRHYA